MAVHTAGFVPAFPQIDLDATSLAHEINNNGGIGALQMLGIKHPVILAGMNAVAHADLVAAVSNAGGLGRLASPRP